MVAVSTKSRVWKTKSTFGGSIGKFRKTLMKANLSISMNSVSNFELIFKIIVLIEVPNSALKAPPTKNTFIVAFYQC